MKKSQLRNIIKESVKQLMTEQAGPTTDPWGNPWVFSSGYDGSTISGPITYMDMSPGLNSVKCGSGYVLDIYYSWDGNWSLWGGTVNNPFAAGSNGAAGGLALRGFRMRCIPEDAIPTPAPDIPLGIDTREPKGPKEPNNPNLGFKKSDPQIDRMKNLANVKKQN
jgi:hypothetical protein